MGAKVRETGGGTAAPVANSFNDFLMQQLRGPATAQTAPYASPQGYNNPAVQGGINQQQSNQAQPFQQTANMMQGPGAGGGVPDMYAGGAPQGQPQQQQQGGFQGAFQNQLSGNVNDLSGANGALQNYFGNPSQNNIPTNFGNTFNPATYQAAQTQQLGTNYGQGQTGMANLGQFGNATQSNFNSQGPINSQFTQGLQGMMGQGMQQMQNGNGGFSAATAGPDVALQGGMDFGGAMNTLGQDPMFARNQARAIADTRARFGAEGAGALGTGAQFAEGNLNAELIAQDASQRRAQAMQLMGQDLNERQTGANVGLQNRGQNMQTSIANMQGGLQANQNQTSLLNQLMGAAGSARGQDMQTQLGQLGLGNQQSMFNAGQQNDAQNNLMQGMLTNQGLGNQFGLGAQTLNNNAMQTNNANNINQSQFQNTFNQNNNQLSAQYGLGANQLNSQNQNLNNQMLQGMVNSGLNLNQLGNSNIQGMLGQLFGGFQQANGLGTAQRETTVTPNPWMQGAQMGVDLVGSFAGK